MSQIFLSISLDEFRDLVREAVADAQADVGATSEMAEEQVWFTRSELMKRWQISLSQIKRLEAITLPVWRIGESDKMKRYFWAYVLAYEGRLTREEANRIFDQYTERKVRPLLRPGQAPGNRGNRHAV